VVAVVGRQVDPTRATAEKYGIPNTFTELGEALAVKGVDAAILCTPTQIHAAQAMECMQAGVHVQVEIPLADSLADAEAVNRVQKETGLICMVGHTRRFNPSHQWVHNKIVAGELKIQQMDVHTYFFRRKNINATGAARSGIGVLAASMGAASSLLAAADEPAIAALVADSAFADFGQMIQRQFQRLSRLPAIVLPATLAFCRAITGVTLQHVRPLEAAARLAGRPCLMIHSAGDRFIPAADATRLAAAACAELWITASAGHIGSYRAAPAAYTERGRGFFQRHLA